MAYIYSPPGIDEFPIGKKVFLYLYIYIHTPIIVTIHITYLVGGLEHGFHFPIYWECHHPN